MNWKNVILAVLGSVIPFLYSALVGKFPDFPLDQSNFLAIIIWVVGLAIGGWNLKSIHVKMKANRE